MAKIASSKGGNGKGEQKGPVFETGIVTQVDDAKARVRVKVPSRDNLESYWLEVLQRGSKGNRDYWMPDVDDQVRILTDEKLEAGCVLGAIYSESDPPPVSDRNLYHVEFQDGTIIDFNRTTGKLSILTTGDIDIIAGGNMKLVATRIDFNP